MNRFLQLVSSLTRREDAQDLLEYSLLVAAVTAAGGSVNTIFGDIAAQI